MRRLMALGLLMLWPSIGHGQVDTAGAARRPLWMASVDQPPLGYVTLGVSRPADVRLVLDSVGGLGPRRANRVTFHIGGVTMRPRDVYNPMATMNQLYFQRGILVLLVYGDPKGLPPDRAAFVSRFANARETHREAAWYEIQAPLGDCIWLIAVFSVPDDRLESAGYGYVCKQ